MKHVLIIGGSGMLKEASRWLTTRAEHTSIIGRKRKKLEKVLNGDVQAEAATLISVDYRDSEELKRHIQQAINEHGPIDVVVAWIHSSAPDALEVVDGVVSKSVSTYELYHIKGSTKQIPKEKPKISEQAVYHQIILGFILENEDSRWLNHIEISKGVISAIETKQKVTIVGTIEPWEKRP
ncbi:short-chain dehydrogenase [Halalkalibacillus halophilus]|uniref:short-chain dehydrogenase n=1 Tax=Halalkalibacillus halophilus TaxID=392827 RepID=UPI00040B254F|nr:short-chain dehydrogenase [Halalkalibacillus halophilus]